MRGASRVGVGVGSFCGHAVVDQPQGKRVLKCLPIGNPPHPVGGGGVGLMANIGWATPVLRFSSAEWEGSLACAGTATVAIDSTFSTFGLPVIPPGFCSRPPPPGISPPTQPDWGPGTAQPPKIRLSENISQKKNYSAKRNNFFWEPNMPRTLARDPPPRGPQPHPPSLPPPCCTKASCLFTLPPLPPGGVF